jgi:hypothetical protein
MLRIYLCAQGQGDRSLCPIKQNSINLMIENDLEANYTISRSLVSYLCIKNVSDFSCAIQDTELTVDVGR